MIKDIRNKLDWNWIKEVSLTPTFLGAALCVVSFTCILVSIIALGACGGGYDTSGY